MIGTPSHQLTGLGLSLHRLGLITVLKANRPMMAMKNMRDTTRKNAPRSSPIM